MLALLLAALDQTIVGTAMPRIVSELHGFELYAWVTTAYLLTSTAVVPIVGKLSDLYGRRWFLLGGAAFFVLASALCGLSQDMNQLIVFRGVQGIGAGILMATVFTVIATLFAPRERARMQGLFSAVFAFASVVGPLVGGYLTDNLSWRWVFYVNLPVGALALAVLFVFYRDTAPRRAVKSIDYLGASTLTAAIVPLLLALSLGGNQHAWDSPEIIGMFAFAVAMFLAFVWSERRTDEPIIPFALFKNRMVTVSVIGLTIMGISMFGTILFIPLFIQGVIGTTATQSGTILMPMMFAMIGSSVISGQIIARTGKYKLMSVVGPGAGRHRPVPDGRHGPRHRLPDGRAQHGHDWPWPRPGDARLHVGVADGGAHGPAGRRHVAYPVRALHGRGAGHGRVRRGARQPLPAGARTSAAAAGRGPATRAAGRVQQPAGVAQPRRRPPCCATAWRSSGHRP